MKAELAAMVDRITSAYLGTSARPEGKEVRAFVAKLGAHLRAGNEVDTLEHFTQPDGSAKMAHSLAAGYYNIVLYLAPSDIIPGYDLCPWATPGCRAACIFKTGRAGIPGMNAQIVGARIRRTLIYLADLPLYVARLLKEIDAHATKAREMGLPLIVRPNGTSDHVVLAHRLAKARPEITFNDYTKRPHPERFQLPNYRLVFSAAETEKNRKQAKEALAHGVNVAMVFGRSDGKKLRDLPTEHPWGVAVIDGDVSDARAMDPRGVIVGLRAKGAIGKHDETGFVEAVR